MNPLTVIVLSVCLAFSAAQTTPAGQTGNVPSGNTPSTDMPSGNPPVVTMPPSNMFTLSSVNMPSNSMSSVNMPGSFNIPGSLNMPTMAATAPPSVQTGYAAPAANTNSVSNANPFDQLLNNAMSNPLMLLSGLFGGDRARSMFFYAPFMRPFLGNLAPIYGMKGAGFEKMTGAAISSQIVQMLARYGIDPRFAGFLLGDMFNAGDNFGLYNLLAGSGTTPTGTSTTGTSQPLQTNSGSGFNFLRSLAPFVLPFVWN